MPRKGGPPGKKKKVVVVAGGQQSEEPTAPLPSASLGAPTALAVEQEGKYRHRECERKISQNTFIAIDQAFKMEQFDFLDSLAISLHFFGRSPVILARRNSTEEKDILEEEEIAFHLLKIDQELRYLCSAPFVEFWRLLTNEPRIIALLDGLLRNLKNAKNAA